MFRLEDAIGKWKEALIGDGAINANECLELESHLRESIVALQSQSLSEQEAFLVAANRVGKPVELQEEFKKNSSVNRWRYRLFWMLVGFLGLKAVGSTLGALSAMLGTAMAASGFSGPTSAIAMSVAILLLWMGVFVLGFRQRQCLGVRGEGLSQVLLVIVGAALIIGPMLSTAARLGMARLADPNWFGEAAIYSTIGGNSLNLFVVLFCFAAMWKLSERENLATN